MTLPEDPLWLTALLAGLAGFAHCTAMCGPLAGALTLSSSAPGVGRRWVLIVAHNTGRLLTYAALGAVFGLLSGWLFEQADLMAAQRALRWVAGAFLVVLGLYLAGWWQGLAWLERGGAWLWRRVQPRLARLLPITTLPRAISAGLLWGFLPCGMVYSALALALWAESPAGGATVMLAFGLGTLPALFAAALAADRLRAVLARPGWRVAAGLSVIALGVWTVLMRVPQGAAHMH